MVVLAVWSANELVGLVAGGVLLGTAAAATRVDAFVAGSQRRELGLCDVCGGVGKVRGKGGELERCPKCGARPGDAARQPPRRQ